MHEVATALANLAENTQNPLFDTLGEAFAKAGHELALVGGPVRDAILGRQTLDLDFTTSASAEEILKVIKPLATATWDVGREFGTIAAEISGQRVEITSYRADSYDKDSRNQPSSLATTLKTIWSGETSPSTPWRSGSPSGPSLTLTRA
jgi:poly(A) polymerase